MKKVIFPLSALIIGGALISMPGTSIAEDKATDEAFNKKMDAYLSKDDNLEKLGSAIEKYFLKKRDEQMKQQEMSEKNKVEEQFKNPVKVELGKSPIKGNPDAKITVVEFSDFECPYCKGGYKTMQELLKAYPNDVKIAFKNLPLEFHQEAKPAAKAALAAGAQGKFWEMYSQLFENQEKLQSKPYEEFAKTLGLDIEKFNKDMASEEIAKQIEDDVQLARQLGVQGTPGFFVNGVQVKGAQPLPYFKQLVDRWLAKK